jgi:hypothetical protein
MLPMNAQAPRAATERHSEEEAPMDQRTMPSPRIKPLPPDHSPELKEQFEAMRNNLGFIPNIWRRHWRR